MIPFGQQCNVSWGCRWSCDRCRNLTQQNPPAQDGSAAIRSLTPLSLARCILGSNDTAAFVDFNFAPPSLRRAIAMLGFIHKRVQGTCHPVLVKDLPFVSDRSYTFHAKTLESHFNQVRAYRGLYNTSLWSYILIYNRLPQGLIEQETVKSFQSKLLQLPGGMLMLYRLLVLGEELSNPTRLHNTS